MVGRFNHGSSLFSLRAVEVFSPRLQIAYARSNERKEYRPAAESLPRTWISSIRSSSATPLLRSPGRSCIHYAYALCLQRCLMMTIQHCVWVYLVETLDEVRQAERLCMQSTLSLDAEIKVPAPNTYNDVVSVQPDKPRLVTTDKYASFEISASKAT